MRASTPARPLRVGRGDNSLSFRTCREIFTMQGAALPPQFKIQHSKLKIFPKIVLFFAAHRKMKPCGVALGNTVSVRTRFKSAI